MEKVFTGSSAKKLVTDSKHWYVVYTRPGRETKVARLLAKKKIEHYCPRVKVSMLLQNKKKISKEPLFKSYVFVYISESGQGAIKKTEGIINFVYWLNNPVIVRKEEIEDIKAFLNFNTNLLHFDYKIRVNVNDQPLNGVQYYGNSRITEIKHNGVKLEVPPLKCVLVFENNLLHVDPISKSHANHTIMNSRTPNDAGYKSNKSEYHSGSSATSFAPAVSSTDKFLIK